MRYYKKLLLHNRFKIAALLLMVPLLIINPVSASDFTNRSVMISNPLPSASSTQTVNIRFPSTNSVGSLELRYCSNSPLFNVSCTAPVGLSVNSVTLGSQTGNTGFSKDNANTSGNRIVLTRAPASGIITDSTYVLNGIVNPSNIGTVFIRIASYATTDATGPRTDQGVVAFAITSAFSVGLYVPPYLTFCAGATVSPDCSSVSQDIASFGELSSKKTASTTTQIAGSTNDPTGYSVFMSGVTMISGNNIIQAMPTQIASQVGQSQFGVNLKSNSSPFVGSDPEGVGSAMPTSAYDTSNLYRFVSGDQIVQSTLPSDKRRFTISYIVNVPAGQEPGTYTTTMTYTAIASF